MAGFLQYQRFRKQEDASAEVMGDLREFQTSLTSRNVKARTLEISINGDNQNPSKKNAETIASEIEGIQRDWMEPAKALETETVVTGIRLVGKAEIKTFYDQLQDLVKQVNQTANERLKNAKQIRAARGAVGIGLTVTASGLAVMLHEPLLYLFTTIGIQAIYGSDYTGILAYMLRNDPSFETAFRKATQAIENPAPETWSFNSWSYTPTQNLVNFLKQGNLDTAETSIYNQDIFDSQGVIGKLKRTEQSKKLAKKAWVGFDQLIYTDAEGETSLWFVMRTSNTKPKYTQKAPQTSPSTKLEPKTVPILVPSF